MPELAAAVSAAPPIVPSPVTLDLPLQHRHDVRLLPASLVPETRTVEVVWSTGAEVRREDPWTGKPFHEVLLLEPGHVDPSRLESGAPLLDSHAAVTLDADPAGRCRRRKHRGEAEAASGDDSRQSPSTVCAIRK